MIKARRAAALAALSVLAALAVATAGQSRAGGSDPGRKIDAWEKQLVLPQKVSARLTWAERRLKPSGLHRLEQMGRTLAPAIAAGNGFSTLRKQAEVEVLSSYPGLKDGDVSEAAFLVMSMATKDMDSDIRMIMAEIKTMNAAKQKMRELIRDLNQWISDEMSKHPGSKDIDNDKVTGSRPPVAPTRRMSFETKTSPVLHLEYAGTPVVPPLPRRNPGMSMTAIRSLKSEVEGNLDGVNEMSETTAARLQLVMDRRSKFIETLSNMMKKIGTTMETLAQNIK
jgi:hypothetical protein